ncbi:MAG TPA: exosortase/archaeosortase family protein, partial [Terriglobales bacterium]
GRLAAAAAAIVLAWAAGFVLFYGVRCARAALFPWAMLLLAIPLPPSLVEVAEIGLQRGSAEVTYQIFQLTGTPVFREGLIFSLPGFAIEVAQQCSGIRSAISLLITSLTLGHLFLRSGWSKAWCVLLTIPIAIVKNAVRIATLALLGMYVSQDYLHGSLHHRGGPVFSLLSLALLLASLWVLRKREDSVARGKQAGRGSSVAVNQRPSTA